MTEGTDKRLPDALARHTEGGRLKAAFQQANAMNRADNNTRRSDAYNPKLHVYERTALTRWLTGATTPRDEQFMTRLADKLDDAEVLAAWRFDVGSSAREVRDLVTRFRKLTAIQKRDVLPALLDDVYQHADARRTSFSMRIEVKPGHARHSHRLDVALGWIGQLPERATVQIASDEYRLRDAYSDKRCIFREFVPMDPTTLMGARSGLQTSTPVLRYKPARARSFETAELQNLHDDDGVYEFATEAVREAEIRLNVCLPYPADLPIYPVMLGAYAVAGRVTITIVTDQATCGQPHALQFLGDTPTWAHAGDFNRCELSLEIGDDESLIEPHSGIIFFWRPEPLGVGE